MAAGRKTPKHAKHAANNNRNTADNDLSSYYIPRKKKRRVPLVITILVVFILTAVLACAGALVWYNAQLEHNMRPDDIEYNQLQAVLDDVGYDKPCYTLLLGSDTRTGTQDINDPLYASGVGQSDVMVLIRTDPKTKTITMLSIPRDTPISVNGQTVKINRCIGLEGPAGAVTAVENLTGVQISHYAQMSFVDLGEFIDALGGVTVDVPQAIKGDNILDGDSPISIDAGTQTLDGEHAVFFARQRKAYGSDQEAKRQNNVRSLVTAAASKMTSKPLYDYPQLGLDLSKCLTSDVNLWDAMSLAVGFGGSDTTFYSGTGPYSGDYNVVDGDSDWYCYPNEDGWSKVITLVDSGGDPSDITY